MDPDLEQLEERLIHAGNNLAYPPTPLLAMQVRSRLNQPMRTTRRWAFALVILLILSSALMLVPPARAAILDFIQIGVVRIFRAAPTPQTKATPAFEIPLTAEPATATPLTATPEATSLPALVHLAGETTLAKARSKVDFAILLPTYPADLGQPDKVYLQDMGSPMLVLVWLDREHPDKVRLSLDEITPGSWTLQKFEPQGVEETNVKGQRAIWAVGPYILQITGNYSVMRRLVEGHTLIWTQADMTYRLETDLSLKEAIKIGESLH